MVRYRTAKPARTGYRFLSSVACEMAVDYSKLRGLTARKLIAALEKDGFVLDRQRGSHRLYRQPDGRRVTLAYHRSGSTFAPKTLRSMIESQAQWDEDDLVRLGLSS